MELIQSIRKNPMLYKCLCVCVLVVLLFTLFPAPAHADMTAFIQCSIDIDNWQILSAAVREDVGLTHHSPEVRRVETSTLESLASNSGSLSAGISALSGIDSGVLTERNGKIANGNGVGGLLNNGENFRVLTFPGATKPGDDSSSDDYERALGVNNALIYSLNQAFSLYLQDRNIAKTNDAVAFRNAMVSFLNDVESKASASSDTVILTYDGITQEYQYRAAKGYDSVHDAEYVNWAMLAYEGFLNYSFEGEEAVTENNVYVSTPSQLEKGIASVLGSMLDGLRSLLGLWSMDELFFNQGLRDSGYVGGIFPNSWEPTIWALFIVVEVFSALILLLGIISNVSKKALSTTNMFMRANAMQQVQDVIVCAIALSLLPLILRIVISMSASISDMICTIIPTDSAGNPMTVSAMVGQHGGGSGISTIAGVIMQFLFFGVQVYFNFFYAIRALTVAILIIISPAMVAIIAVSDKQKQTVMTWAKELLANVFIQPIHAFLMVVILLLPTSSHGFDNLIALYALIPLTTVIKSLFFGSAGGWAEQTAQRARARATGTLGGLAVGTAASVAAAPGAIKGIAGTVKGRSRGSSGSGSSGRSEATSTEGVADMEPDLGKSRSVANVTETNSEMPGEQKAVSDVSKTKQQDASNNETRFAKVKRFGAQAVDVGKRVARPLMATATTLGGMAAVTAGTALQGAGISAGAPIASMGRAALTYKQPEGTPTKQNQKENPRTAQAQQAQPTSSVKGEPRVLPENNLGREHQKEDGSLRVDADGGLHNMGVIPGRMKQNQDKLVSRFEMNEDDAAQNGISNIRDRDGRLSFNAQPTDSPFSQELQGYAKALSNMPDEDSLAIQKDTGVSVTQMPDGSYQVDVDKKRWSDANGGAMIQATRGYDSNGERVVNGMAIEAPKGTAPSFVGTPNRYVASSIPLANATVVQATVPEAQTAKSEAAPEVPKEQPVRTNPVSSATPQEQASVNPQPGKQPSVENHTTITQTQVETPKTGPSAAVPNTSRVQPIRYEVAASNLNPKQTQVLNSESDRFAKARANNERYESRFNNVANIEQSEGKFFVDVTDGADRLTPKAQSWQQYAQTEGASQNLNFGDIEPGEAENVDMSESKVNKENFE